MVPLAGFCQKTEPNWNRTEPKTENNRFGSSRFGSVDRFELFYRFEIGSEPNRFSGIGSVPDRTEPK